MAAPKPTAQKIAERFQLHRPATDQVGALHDEVRAQCIQLAQFLNESLPASREASLALTALQEACQWANGAVAIHHPDNKKAEGRS